MTSNVCYKRRALLIFSHHVSQSRRPLKRIPNFQILFNGSECSNWCVKSITNILKTCNCCRLGQLRLNTWAWCQIFFVRWMHCICCDRTKCGCIKLLQMKAKQNQYQNMKPTIPKIWRQKKPKFITKNCKHKTKERNWLTLSFLCMLYSWVRASL